MRALPAVLIGTCLLLVACEAGQSDGTMSISGDSIVHAATFELPDGQQSVFCRYAFTAQLAGRTDSATITQGRVTFSFLDTGTEHMTWEWTPERLPELWPDATLAAGDTLRSAHQDINFSLPFRPVRGSVVFDYTLAGNDAVRATEPFVFTCR